MLSCFKEKAEAMTLMQYHLKGNRLFPFLRGLFQVLIFSEADATQRPLLLFSSLFFKNYL